MVLGEGPFVQANRQDEVSVVASNDRRVDLEQLIEIGAIHGCALYWSVVALTCGASAGRFFADSIRSKSAPSDDTGRTTVATMVRRKTPSILCQLKNITRALTPKIWISPTPSA